MSEKLYKRIRISGGRWVTRTLKQSSVTALAAAADDEIWDCGEGRMIVVDDMDVTHITNVIALLEKRARAGLGKVNADVTQETIEAYASGAYPIYKKLRLRLVKIISQTVKLPAKSWNKSQPELPSQNPPERHFNFNL